MKTEWRIFLSIAAFLLFTAVLYGAWTLRRGGAVASSGSAPWPCCCRPCSARCAAASSGSSPAGSTCARRTGRTARSPTARVRSASSARAATGRSGLALAAAIAGLGLVFWQLWLLGLGAVAVIFAACGLLFEYYSGTRRTAEH